MVKDEYVKGVMRPSNNTFCEAGRENETVSAVKKVAWVYTIMSSGSSEPSDRTFVL